MLELGKEVFSLQATLGAPLAPCDPDKLAAQELMALSEFAGTSSSLLGQVTGVVKLESIAALERVLFRATRGNAGTRFARSQRVLPRFPGRVLCACVMCCMA